jgi:uncharacterized protein
LSPIDPKAIGVGQYQHDLGESKLASSLDAVVEDCVNAVGVDANIASARVSARRWRKASSSTATPTARSSHARR